MFLYNKNRRTHLVRATRFGQALVLPLGMGLSLSQPRALTLPRTLFLSRVLPHAREPRERYKFQKLYILLKEIYICNDYGRQGEAVSAFVGATKEGTMTECTRCGSKALRFVSVCANGDHLYQCANCMKIVAMDPNSMDSKESE